VIVGCVFEASGKQAVSSMDGQVQNFDADVVRTQNAELEELRQELRREI